MKRKMGWAALMILSLLPGLAKADDTPMEAEAPIALTSPSAILCEASTGRVVFEKNADERRPVASVNKVMTILLTLEALDEGRVSAQDQVTVSPRAASMGGSQAFLDAGERYPLGELLKTVIVASANDSAVAIAEHLAGAEEAFVKLMNARADELGLQNTHYVNCTGLPAPDHYTTARDVAKLSAQLDLHPLYYRYSTIWMDEIRHRGGRVTALTNTNRLVRFYPGCDGYKTGSTNEARYCISATAKKDGMRLIAVEKGRVIALGGQRGALVDAEAVLLVGDDEPEVLVLHVRREQGMRADDEGELAGPETFVQRAALPGLGRGGEQCAGDAEWLQKRGE